MANFPNCAACKYGYVLADSGSHFECKHPLRHREVNHLTAELVGSVAATNAPRPLNVRGNAHGIAQGWFAWPLNFDVVWLEACDGFEARS